MKPILEEHPCYEDIPGMTKDVVAYVDGQPRLYKRPRMPLLCAEIAASHAPSVRIGIEMLLDTGTDITIIKPEKVRELGERLGGVIPPLSVQFEHELAPAYDLKLVFPGNHSYSGCIGFIAPEDHEFDLGDVWLGQDVLNQLVVTFDGVNGTVTIVDPKDP